MPCIDQIADRTDGVPLFVEELTKSVLESGLLRAETDRYVARRGSAAVRDPDKPVCVAARAAGSAGVGAAGGADWRGDRTRVSLCVAARGLGSFRGWIAGRSARLVGSELVFQRGTPPDAVYSFKHALVQDVAYGSLLRGSRQTIARANRRGAGSTFARS